MSRPISHKLIYASFATGVGFSILSFIAFFVHHNPKEAIILSFSGLSFMILSMIAALILMRKSKKKHGDEKK